MKIALISSPKDFKKFEENIKVTSEEFGKHPPLGLAYIAALVREHGHKPVIIDVASLKLSKEMVLQKLKNFKPDLIGVGIHSIYYLHPCLDLLKYLKNNLNLPILVGGAGFNLYPDEIILYNSIDYGLTGAVSKSLPSFLDALENGKNYKRIPGLYFKEKKKIYRNAPEKSQDDIDSLPFPARDLLKNEIYWQFISQKKNFTNMLTSIGCSFNCKFCNEQGGEYKTRKVDKVIKEIKECYYKYKIREIDFFDRTFTIDKKRVKEICNEIIKNKLDISWSCRSRIDTVDKELLEIMKKAGCFAIFYGIESADETVLKNLNKEITLQQVRDTIKMTKEIGIKPLGFFMFGSPGDTEKSMKKTIDFATSLDLKYATFTKTMAKPKSIYDEMNIRNTGYDYWKEYILGRCKERAPIRTWTNLDDELLNSYVKKAFYRFYFRPKYILNTIKDFKSIREVWRYSRSTIKFFFSG